MQFPPYFSATVRSINKQLILLDAIFLMTSCLQNIDTQMKHYPNVFKTWPLSQKII